MSQAHIRRQTAELQVETAQAAMDQSAESLRIVKNRYDAGLATITDLLRAEDAERQSQFNYWHAVYGNAMAYTELLYATGTLTPDAAEELAMKSILWTSLLAASASMIAGCHDGESAKTPADRTKHAGPGC